MPKRLVRKIFSGIFSLKRMRAPEMEHDHGGRCGTPQLSPRLVRGAKPSIGIPEHGVTNMFRFKSVLAATVIALAPLAVASPSVAQGWGSKAMGFSGGGARIGGGSFMGGGRHFGGGGRMGWAGRGWGGHRIGWAGRGWRGHRIGWGGRGWRRGWGGGWGGGFYPGLIGGGLLGGGLWGSPWGWGWGGGWGPGLGWGSPFYSDYGYDDGYYDDGPAVAPTVVRTNGRDVTYCQRRFKSYDVRSGTYLGHDGKRHPCPRR